MLLEMKDGSRDISFFGIIAIIGLSFAFPLAGIALVIAAIIWKSSGAPKTSESPNTIENPYQDIEKSIRNEIEEYMKACVKQEVQPSIFEIESSISKTGMPKNRRQAMIEEIKLQFPSMQESVDRSIKRKRNQQMRAVERRAEMYTAVSPFITVGKWVCGIMILGPIGFLVLIGILVHTGAA